jgi:hypothetical protein
VLKLEGRLADAWVDELARVTDGALADNAGLTLDLRGLSYADARGVAVLRQAAGLGARLAGGSAFVNALITGSGQV